MEQTATRSVSEKQSNITRIERCIVFTVQATTRPGSTLRQFRRQLGRERLSNTARGVARSAARSNLNQVTSWPSSTGVPVVSLTQIWICSSRTRHP